MVITINSDGASRGNPGQAGYGFVIRVLGGHIIHQEGKRIGVATNNIAEYTGIKRALEYIVSNLASKKIDKVLVMADSQLAVRQLEGEYKVKNPALANLFFEIRELEKKIGDIEYRHVPREENYIADRLANIALDS